MVIVSQEYHLYRVLYLTEKLGIEAVGVCADRRPYRNQELYELREIVARCKDVLYGLKQPRPSVMGNSVMLSGNGDFTAEDRPVAKS
jgi:vancomycin permeability regulator SanA